MYAARTDSQPERSSEFASTQVDLDFGTTGGSKIQSDAYGSLRSGCTPSALSQNPSASGQIYKPCRALGRTGGHSAGEALIQDSCHRRPVSDHKKESQKHHYRGSNTNFRSGVHSRADHHSDARVSHSEINSTDYEGRENPDTFVSLHGSAPAYV